MRRPATVSGSEYNTVGFRELRKELQGLSHGRVQSVSPIIPNPPSWPHCLFEGKLLPIARQSFSASH